MLGRFEILSQDAEPVLIRSKKAGALLAYLALHRGKALARHLVQDMFWPDADGDRQYQSLRRAVSDLREDLSTGGLDPSILHADQGALLLERDHIRTDLDVFAELLSNPTPSDEFLLHGTEAIALYGGPFLAPIDGDWVLAYRRQFEEMYCRAVEVVCELLIAKGHFHDAQRISASAIVLAPQREEPYVSSIRAYTASGNDTMATQQFEVLEQMLDEHFGQTPSDGAFAALEKDPSATSKLAISPADDDGSRSVVGGAIQAESRYYIVRDSDELAAESLRTENAVVLVFGPRQVGKTSLLARSSTALQSEGVGIVLTDFQSLGSSEIQSQATFYRALIHSFATQVGIDHEPAWNELVGANWNLDAQIGALLKSLMEPVCWVMDEVDRLFGTDYADDFFGLVRSWHNRRAFANQGPWKRLRLLISYATEAQLFIKDLNQSPFNVGVRVTMNDFSPAQVEDLGSRYSFDRHTSMGVFEVAAGHPFLTRKAFSFLADGADLVTLRMASDQPDGPFGDHLKRLLAMIRKSPEMEAAVSSLLAGEGVTDSQTLARMRSSGLLAGSTSKQAVFRCSAYESFLRKSLELESSTEGS